MCIADEYSFMASAKLTAIRNLNHFIQKCQQNNLRSGPFLASPICSLMSSLAKIGRPEFLRDFWSGSAKFLADQIRDLIGC